MRPILGASLHTKPAWTQGSYISKGHLNFLPAEPTYLELHTAMKSGCHYYIIVFTLDALGGDECTLSCACP